MSSPGWPAAPPVLIAPGRPSMPPRPPPPPPPPRAPPGPFRVAPPPRHPPPRPGPTPPPPSPPAPPSAGRPRRRLDLTAAVTDDAREDQRDDESTFCVHDSLSVADWTKFPAP